MDPDLDPVPLDSELATLAAYNNCIIFFAHGTTPR